MSENTRDDRRSMHFGLLLMISFAIFNLGFVVDQTVRWSNHFHGLMNGVYHVMLFGFAWSIYLLPWSLAVFFLYRWRKWKRFRTHWVLAPAALAFLALVSALITHPPTPSSRFANFANAELPNRIQHLHYDFSGGGLADYGDTYYFETSQGEVDRLIADMGLWEDESYGVEGNDYTPIPRLPECPDLSTWEGAKQYRGGDDGWYYYLITDSSRTRVYIFIGCI